MRVDFYQSSRDPVEDVVALLAHKTLQAGARLLVVAADPVRLDRISEALWSAKGQHGEQLFLANGRVGGAHDARQPVLLSDRVEAVNGARFVALADGLWRDEVLVTGGVDRVFLIFDDASVAGARDCWQQLGRHEALIRNFWKQKGGRWLQVV